VIRESSFAGSGDKLAACRTSRAAPLDIFSGKLKLAGRRLFIYAKRLWE
jgi:hypothetical protein